MVQIVLGLIALAVVAGITFFIYRMRKSERPDLDYLERVSLDSLLGVVKREMAELIRDDDLVITNDLHFEAISRIKRRIKIAQDDSINGIKSAKKIIIAQIREIVERELPTVKDVYDVIGFNELNFLEPYYKWEILIYKLKKRIPSGKVIHYLDSEYALSKERMIIDPLDTSEQPGMVKRRIVNEVLIDEMFSKEVITWTEEEGAEPPEEPLKYTEMLDIISIIIFTRYRGIGKVDTLRELDIDGFHFGTSGSIRYKIEGNFEAPYRTTNSVWVQINAEWIHFAFIDFYKENEMKRIVNQMVSWGTTAPMTEKSPAKVNDDAEGNRVTAIRPPAGEDWAVFLRKFSSGIYKVPLLLNKMTPEVVSPTTGEVIKPSTEILHNWQLVDRLVYFLMKSESTTAFTGQQNTGKTSMMKAAIEYTPEKNIRILEMSFELALREIYPHRDTYDVKPTDYITSSQLQDLLKKTDGYMSMVGEVAEDIVAARMIQFCLIASAFTIFSHHGKDDYGLINGLTNSLVASGEYGDHAVAMSTVLDAIKNNVHLYFHRGQRVVQYVSEIVKLDEISPYPDLSKCGSVVEALEQLTKVQREYYTRSTDRVKFESRKIIVFDEKTMTYRPNQWYTSETFKRMCSNMQPDDRKDFIKFYNDNWR